MPVSTEGPIGIALRTMLDGNGFSSVKIIGYEHNWVDAANYPVQLVRFTILSTCRNSHTSRQMQQAGSAFAGVSFHCYQGTVSQQAQFTSVYPTKVRMVSMNSARR